MCEFCDGTSGGVRVPPGYRHKPLVRSSWGPKPWPAPTSLLNETIPRTATYVAYPSNGIAWSYHNSFSIQFLDENPDVPAFNVSRDPQYSVIKTCYTDMADGELEIGSFSPDSVACALFEI